MHLKNKVIFQTTDEQYKFIYVFRFFSYRGYILVANTVSIRKIKTDKPSQITPNTLNVELLYNINNFVIIKNNQLLKN